MVSDGPPGSDAAHPASGWRRKCFTELMSHSVTSSKAQYAPRRAFVCSVRRSVNHCTGARCWVSKRPGTRRAFSAEERRALADLRVLADLGDYHTAGIPARRVGDWRTGRGRELADGEGRGEAREGVERSEMDPSGRPRSAASAVTFSGRPSRGATKVSWVGMGPDGGD